MNNLTTRKIVLGMLMALVLAFSVQGTADALEFKDHSSTDGDLRTVLPGGKFTIKFSVSLGSNTTKIYNDDDDLSNKDFERIDSSGYKVFEATNGKVYRLSPAANALENTKVKGSAGTYSDTSGDLYVDTSKNVVDGSGAAVYIESGAGTADEPYKYTRAKADPDDKVAAVDRYHYNQEAVTITLSAVDEGADPTGTTIEKVGSNRLESSGPHVLTETGDDENKLSSTSITLTLTAASAGVLKITISDTTPDEDLPDRDGDNSKDDEKAPDFEFLVYVVPGVGDDDDAPTLTGAGANGVARGDDSGPYENIDDLFDVDPNLPLTYEVQGSGRVYVRINDERESKTTSKLETSSSAPVYLDMNRSSNRVTAWVRGTDAKRESKSITFINTYVDPQITGGSDDQRGATGGRLPEPLEVTVKDGSSSSGKVIPGGVVVGFTSQSDNGDGSMFIPVPGTTVYTTTATDALVTTYPGTPDGSDTVSTTEATATSPMPSEGPVFVRTDSSGKAQVYFQLGDAKGQQRVTITVNGADYENTFFRATAANVVSADAATITIVDGDSQRADADEPLDEPLVVIVKDSGGRIVAGAPVTFTTNSGSLAAPELGDPGVYPPVDSDGEVFGEHTNRFIVVQTDDTGKASVGYNVGDLPGAKQVFATIDVANGRTREKTFSVNGRATSSRDPADDDDEDDDEDEDDTPPPASIVVPPTVTGTAGGTATLTVTAPATATVTAGGLGNTFLSTNVGSFTRSGTTFTSRLTLPNQVADFSLSVFVNNTRYPVTVSVTAAGGQTQTGGRLTVRVDPVSGAPGTTATVTVTATNTAGTLAPNIPVTLSITPGGGSLSPSTVTTGTTGTATSTLTRGSTVGSNYFVTASSTSGYTQSSVLPSGERGRDLRDFFRDACGGTGIRLRRLRRQQPERFTELAPGRTARC